MLPVSCVDGERRSHGHLIQRIHNPCNAGFARSLISQLYLLVRDHSKQRVTLYNPLFRLFKRNFLLCGLPKRPTDK